jgi:hypothetical protein
MTKRRSYYELPWSLDRSHAGRIGVCFHGFYLDRHDQEKLTAEEVRRRGYRLVSLGPLWDGEDRGSSLWETVEEPMHEEEGAPVAAQEAVHHPAHYTHIPGIECIDVVEHFDFTIGNVIKYAWRAGRKDGTTKLEDLRKCAWYVQRAIEREEKEARVGAESAYVPNDEGDLV